MTSALTDLVRYLNTRTDQLAPNTQLKHPFVATETGALVHFAGLRLQSRYLPINEFVYLDRLLRTLHALNYLTQKSRGNLLLRVHQRHVMTVPANHGLAFEELLRPVGLIPAQITLEIDPNGVGDKNRLIAAILGYQSRGYGIALSHFGRSPLDFDIVEAVSPSLVKIDPLLFASTRPLRRIVSKLHDLGARILADGISTGALRRAAQENGIDLFQAPTAFPDICTPPFAAANDAVGVQARTRLP